MKKSTKKQLTFLLLAFAGLVASLDEAAANPQEDFDEMVSYEEPLDQYPDDQDLLAVNSRQWQGVVSIYPEQPYLNGPIVPHCSGTLISPRVVLTALHCVAEIDSTNQSQFLIAAGDSSLREVRKIHRILTRSPIKILDYLYSAYYDISRSAQTDSHEAMTSVDVALLVLDHPMEKITPIEMIPTNFTKNDLKNFRFSPAGYPARSRSSGYDGYRNLVSNLKVCKIVRPSKFTATLITDCTTSPGNSGGPLVLTLQHFPFVAGAAGATVIKQRYSQPSEGELQESYYTNLLDPEIRNWIERMIKFAESNPN